MNVKVEKGNLLMVNDIENEKVVVLPKDKKIKFINTETIFGNCPNVEKLVLPEGVEVVSIENWARNWIEDMDKKMISIPYSVKSIESNCKFVRIECDKQLLEKICNGKTVCSVYGSPSDCQYLLFDLNDENQKLIVPVSNSMSGKFQCTLPWDGEKLDFESYDIHLGDNAAGHKYKQKERLWAMLLRLQYPVELSEENKTAFVSYLTKNVKKLLKELADELDAENIRVLIESGIINKKNNKAVNEIIIEMCSDVCKETMKNADLQEKAVATVPKKAIETKKETISNSNMENLVELYCKIEEVKCESAERTYNDAEMKKIWMVQELANGTGFITRYKGNDTDVVFPTEVAGIKIVGIANRTGAKPKNYDKLTSVVIPDGYVIIGSKAFEGCTNLKTVSIPKTVTEICDEAFANCSELENIVLPPNLRESQSYLRNSGKWMFRDCLNLKNVYVLNPEIEIGTQAAFRGCEKVSVHMEEASKLKMANSSKHYAQITEEEKKLLTKNLIQDGYIETVLIDPEYEIKSPKNGDIVILNNSKPEGGLVRTEVIGLDGTLYGEIKYVGLMVDYLEAVVISEEYEKKGEHTWSAVDIKVTYKG